MVRWSGTYECECCGDQIHNGQWHRCVLCGRWTGRWCRARKTQSAASGASSSGIPFVRELTLDAFHTMTFQERRRIQIREQERRMLDRFRGHPHLFSLHCLIWTMQPNFSVRRFAAYADMCRDCVADKVCIVKLDDGNEERLPINVLRNILLYVGFASSR